LEMAKEHNPEWQIRKVRFARAVREKGGQGFNFASDFENVGYFKWTRFGILLRYERDDFNNKFLWDLIFSGH